ncbi:ABC transporter permease [Roseiarcaceae bacterium H3SJ34-1]|uniref:ABC transporter permease n=1 Tax=Terripilifer ovatus TaxID=3032367 RepID=UPI003AB92407|nr:ABC transporter permease [Roseiarcaceae bacterium H3SJ34-1]
MNSNKAENAMRIGAPFAVGLALLLVWQTLCTAYAVPSYLFPKPSDISDSFGREWHTLFAALGTTLKITLSGFAAACVIGILIAVIFVQSKVIELAFFPYAVLLQVTPIAAVSPLIVILVKNTTGALIVVSTIVALFPIISNTTLGLRSVDPGLLNLFRARRASRLQILLRLRVPSALPYIFAGLRISIGLALIGAVVGEFVAGTGGRGSGLAYQILQAGFQLDIPLMFAALALISVAGIAMFTVMLVLTRLALSHWHESELEARR